MLSATIKVVNITTESTDVFVEQRFNLNGKIINSTGKIIRRVKTTETLTQKLKESFFAVLLQNGRNKPIRLDFEVHQGNRKPPRTMG